jgi:mannosyltransferase
MNTKVKDFLFKSFWVWPLLIGLLLRLYKLTSSSIWHDEGYTMWLLRYNIPEILARTARDVHPPGYYLMAKPWIEIFGNSEFSVRFLSLIFSVGIIYFVFKIIADIWNEKAGFWASMFVALSPFMVRFGQEARMYGVVAFFTTLATYYFVRMVKEKNLKYLYFYVPAMLIAMYTQYYAFFVIISHWIILSIYTKGFWKFNWKQSIKEKVGVFSKNWWVANILLLVGYAPWFPIAYSQVTRISGDYWIKPEWITARTIPGNILNFITYSHLDGVYYWNQFLGQLVYWVIISILIFSVLYLFKIKNKRKIAFSIAIFGYLPMILVFIVSKIASPIYQDRYFPFSAIAILAIWGILISEIRKKHLKAGVIALSVIVLLIGNYNMQKEVNHKMKSLANVVLAQAQEDDLLVSGELYTHLDGSYYLGYGNLYFMSEPIDGFGETSLYYDQQEKYMLSEEEVASYDRFWLIGKVGKGYWDKEFLENYTEITYFEEGGLRATFFTRNQ